MEPETAFVSPTTLSTSRVFIPGSSHFASAVSRPWNVNYRKTSRCRHVNQLRAMADSPTPEDISREEQQKAMEKMRFRLEGLFGSAEDNSNVGTRDSFDGVALRKVIRDRWSVQYDVKPQKRHGRVYVQIMWRYFEQQSFYMEEDEFASHCEAVAQLLQKWDAVDYFCDYIASVKKRPVVGLTVNVPIPNIDGNIESFE